MNSQSLLIKFVRSVLAPVLFFLVASAASAQDTETENEVGFYGTLRGGVSFPSSVIDAYSNEAGHLEFDAGYQAGFSGGFQLTEWVRWDLVDFSYFRSDRTSASGWSDLPEGLFVGYWGNGLSITTGFRFGDFRASSRFRPYVSMGLGGSRAKVNLDGNETSEWGLDANVGFGIEFVVWKHMAIGLRYQFRWVNMNVDFPPVPPPNGLRLVDLSMQYQTLALELVFF